MPNKEYTGTNSRLDEEDRTAIDELVQNGEVESVSSFIRNAVKEKLNPKLRRARIRKELLELLKDDDVKRELGLLDSDRHRS